MWGDIWGEVFERRRFSQRDFTSLMAGVWFLLRAVHIVVMYDWMRARAFFLLAKFPTSPWIADCRGFKHPSFVSWIRSQTFKLNFSGQSSIKWSSLSCPALQRGHWSLSDSLRLVRRMLVGSWLWLKSHINSAFVPLSLATHRQMEAQSRSGFAISVLPGCPMLAIRWW